MPVIELTVVVRAPIDRVFDLSRSVSAHLASTGATRERLVRGSTGLLRLGDEVTWEARHLGLRQRLTSRITVFDPPRHFRDSMVRGAFRRFDHDHHFTSTGQGTRVVDRFDFTSPLGPLGWCADRLFLVRYMRGFLGGRLEFIKAAAESEQWRAYLEGG